MNKPPTYVIVNTINELLKASGSNRKVSSRIEGFADVLTFTVYDPDAGMYYAQSLAWDSLWGYE
jgi:hypothetical protein